MEYVFKWFIGDCWLVYVWDDASSWLFSALVANEFDCILRIASPFPHAGMTYTRILLLIGVLKMPAHSKIKNANKIYSSIIPVICVRLSCDYTRYADLPQTTIEYHKVIREEPKENQIRWTIWKWLGAIRLRNAIYRNVPTELFYQMNSRRNDNCQSLLPAISTQRQRDCEMHEIS